LSPRLSLRSFRYGILAASVLASSVLVIRALAGPFTLLLPVNSPLNAESWLGLSLVLLLITGATRNCTGFASAGAQHPNRIGLLLLSLALLTVLALWRVLALYFLADDFWLVQTANTATFPLHPLFVKGGSDDYFRPAGAISLMLTAQYAAFNPLLWHATALAFHVANVLLVFLLALRLSLRRCGAFFAAALFALHGTRPEAVAWIAGRFDLLSTFFVLAGLLLFLRTCEAQGNPRHVWLLSSLSCMVLAILTKESAYAFAPLAALLAVGRQDTVRRRALVLAPFFLLTAALLVHRWSMYGDIGGYRTALGVPQAFALGLIPTLKALGLRMWAALYFPINWSAEPGRLFGLLLMVSTACWLRLSMTRLRWTEAAIPLGFTILSAIPPLHQLLIGQDLQKSRLLYLPSVGFCLLLGLAARELRPRIRWLLVATVLGFNFVALQHNLNFWEQASTKTRLARAAATGCITPSTRRLIVRDVPGSLRGVYCLANAFPAIVTMNSALGDLPVEFRAQRALFPSASEGGAVLAWDRDTQQLRCCVASACD
jgi:hypothetical protein